MLTGTLKGLLAFGLLYLSTIKERLIIINIINIQSVVSLAIVPIPPIKRAAIENNIMMNTETYHVTTTI